MVYIKNAKIYTGTGKVIEGTIFIKNGKFADIGSTINIPEGARVVDVNSKIITPGLIDVHSHLGLTEQGIGQDGQDVNETSSASTPQVNAIDGINPADTGFEDARRFGVTTVQVMPGSANVIGGEMVVVKTVGKVVDEMIVKNPSGLKAATGENPKRVYGSKGKMPTTRMGLAARLRENLIEAQNYIEDRKTNTCGRDLGLENIAKVLRKEIPLRVHAHRADDIATVLRIKKEFGINLTIEHCTEGHQIADFIAQHDVRVSVGPTMSPRSKTELSDKGWNTILTLSEAGIPVSITTDHPVIAIEHLMTSAILAVKNGFSEGKALEAITLNAAKHIGVEDRVGSIEKGKDADFVIWNGDPFDLRSTIETTYIEGKVVYQK
ncbi:amidohydrolase [Sporosarcina sp. 6E9]|uniref:amidohydrolase n=1 Tax=Sporosarcina sp. 6E9 TaxID=2819235 RepID=UPI001B30EC45|nr:amidohydrolase [Sporosarcina sp. 6E9]